MPLIKTDASHRSRYTLVAFCVFLAVAGFYLVTEHRAHLLGWLPYLIFLLCPLMHLFMHRSHPHGREADANGASAGERTTAGHEHH
jgi:hypothetical protein